MIGKIFWGIAVAIFLVQPAWCADAVEENIESPGNFPATIYSKSPFEENTTTVRLGDVLGSKAGYVHPYLSVGGYYTDNLFNREYKRESDFITRVTPGIWVVLPNSRYPLISVNTLNTAPGGLGLSRIRTRGRTRLQAYAKYQADILLHDKFESEDQVNQRAEGYVRYNFRGGLSIDVLDIYELDHDAYGTGTSRQLDKFKSNLVTTSVLYEMTPKTRMEGEYGFYTLSYNADRNAYRERDDHSFAGRFFYRFLPKTSAFLEYDFITIDYDDDVISDSDEHQVYLGLQWIATVKSSLRARVGYGVKDFDASGSDEANNLLAEIRLRHRFTPKSYIELNASRQTNETDIAETAYTLSQKYQLRYFQRFTTKLTTSANFYYKRNSYRGGDVFSDRVDEYYSAGLDMKYAFTNWLALSAGYTFLKRNSNFIAYDYDRNNVYMSLIFAL
ncbi:MAG: polysaccharide biosynthesis protein VpsM [Desulfuromonadales bacterium]|nr:polysaccharide biosynthesis protein VpsM [Desulfuromonadales bacterium]